VVNVTAHDYRRKLQWLNIYKAKRTIAVSPGESVRILRELQEMSQNDLAEASGIPQSRE
jgi:hypothetical protein